jgi:hypothetical protein
MSTSGVWSVYVAAQLATDQEAGPELMKLRGSLLQHLGMFHPIDVMCLVLKHSAGWQMAGVCSIFAAAAHMIRINWQCVCVCQPVIPVAKGGGCTMPQTVVQPAGLLHMICCAGSC